MTEEIRIPYEEMQDTFFRTLLLYGFSKNQASLCAGIFAGNSLDGVYTHGVNRFKWFINSVIDKHIIPGNIPEKVGGFGGFEQWNGNLGPGPANAIFCTEKTMELARTYGIGCIALANTNHWMRGGTYAWKAAKEGFAFICWTNTIANMPAWGAKESRLGNNPLIMGMPEGNEAVVLDMAVSQFSFGVIKKFAMNHELLPIAGGYDEAGQLTNDPQKILASNRSLPIGYWKGSGLSLLLDVFASVLSGGKSTHEITAQKSEMSVSQVFIAIDLSHISNTSRIAETVSRIIEDYRGAALNEGSGTLAYPGERVLQTRKENLEKGIPVNSEVWSKILALSK